MTRSLEGQRDDAKKRAFSDWLKDKSIDVDGIRATEQPGKGLSIVALRDIREGESIIRVPSSAILVVNPEKCNKNRETVHGALAGELVLNGKIYKPWLDLMPSLEDFQASMPVLWSKSLREILPPAAQALLRAQTNKLQLEYRTFLSLHCKEEDQEQLRTAFTHAWLLVNTRSFYWDYPVACRKMSTTKGKKHWKKSLLSHRQRPSSECLALCPLIDFFNHTIEEEKPCCVSFDPAGYTVTAKRSHVAGEELHVSYGTHSNDFLLVEYGFLVQRNTADSVSLDHLISTMFDDSQKSALEESNMWGDYALIPQYQHSAISDQQVEGNGRSALHLTTAEVCHRTQTALRLVLISPEQWRRFADGRDGGETEEAGVNSLVHEVLERLTKECQEASASLGKLLEAESSWRSDSRKGTNTTHLMSEQLRTIQNRWDEIGVIATAVIE